MLRGSSVALMFCLLQLGGCKVSTQQAFPEVVVLYPPRNFLAIPLEQAENPANICGQRFIFIFEPKPQPDPVKPGNRFWMVMSWFIPICTAVIVAFFIYWLVHQVTPIARMQKQLDDVQKTVEKLEKKRGGDGAKPVFPQSGRRKNGWSTPRKTNCSANKQQTPQRNPV